ncbi:MAG: tRNA (N6-threonylcarbamoyladenosine(37)-N6)-methyltransferase TrmO [Thermodesulfovibrio sp. RBG_19FT_COMBO_42_12]|nr:MAG: tRNA (N6-threonylcarbamoyladenosine(37)-N6)-methyltransferase TrmO [Thermodesulfovibrio sp. RBG_19FT_COMBO_42_12]
MRIKPIGIIHSPFQSGAETPIQPSRSRANGQVEVFKEYQEGLEDIEGFSHIILIYWFHKSKGYSLKVKPFLDDTLRGVFATRAPSRPNQIGLSVVRLLERKENILYVKGIDVLDGTPLLDIKPHVPDFESGEIVRIGWLEGKIFRRSNE